MSDIKLSNLSKITTVIETAVAIKEHNVEKRKLDVMDVEEESPVVKKMKSTEVLIKEHKVEKRKGDVKDVEEESPVVKKMKSLSIVFDVDQTTTVRERTDSVGSDYHVKVTTATSSHTYDTLPPLSVSPERKAVWCRAFPACRYGSSCAFLHPRCKFAASCTRRDCVYSHNGPAPVSTIASHGVPEAKYKSTSAKPLPAKCKYYPSCTNPACHYYHPKPCRYGNACGNKLKCYFYHADVESLPRRASSTYNNYKPCRYGNACKNKLDCYFDHAPEPK